MEIQPLRPARLRPRGTGLLLASSLLLVGCERAPTPLIQLVPFPAEAVVLSADPFLVSAETPVVVDAGDVEAAGVAAFLVEWVANREDERPDVLQEGDSLPGRYLRLTRRGASTELGEEGYTLEVGPDSVVIRASGAPGLFYGIQTLRQLLPSTRRPSPFPSPCPPCASPTRRATAGAGPCWTWRVTSSPLPT
jgi:hexosaminidase